MAIRPILTAGEPVLRQKSKKVTSFGPSLEALVEDMLDSMHAVNGLGLAAPQIGVPLRVIVIEMPAETDEEGNEIEPSQLYVFCNPEIVKTYGEDEEDDEACLSVPGYFGAVKRATAITVKGFKSLYDECRLEIRPPPLLAGANSSGKTSAMQPLLLLKQTLEASYDPGPLLLDGPNVKLTSTKQALCRLALGGQIESRVAPGATTSGYSGSGS